MEERHKDERWKKTLKMIAPGTSLYEGLENILRARTGALMVVSDSEDVMKLVDGGFKIDTELEPSKLYELAKMDGAIIISRDSRRIVYANAHLSPDSAIATTETGSRHRTAARVAAQTGEVVIAISQRRNIITVFQGGLKYIVRDIGTTLTRANQALQTLQKYKNVLTHSLTKLSGFEFEDLVTLADVVVVIQRMEMVNRISDEISWYICELGAEGRLVDLQLDELIADLEEEIHLLFQDYLPSPGSGEVQKVLSELKNFASEDLLDANMISRMLGFGGTPLDAPVVPRGYRVMRKIPRLPMSVVENLVAAFRNLQGVINASIKELDEVEGIGEVRAKAIKDGLQRLREQVLLS
ncbi:MAG: DNA integrity scanning diadenylate cyclase DisA [Bacillota bacterium]